MTPRENWKEIVQKQCLLYEETLREDGRTTHYWNESAAYEFSSYEVYELEKVTENLHRMSLEAARFLANEQSKKDSPWRGMGLPDYAVECAVKSLQRGDLDVYGRFDLCYDGENPTEAKMLEYNADTPTGLIEGSIVQWYWFQDKMSHLDQWNGIHEALVNRWKQIKTARGKSPSGADSVMHFAYTGLDESGEDILTTQYMLDCAFQAGWNVNLIEMTEIGYNHDTIAFVDQNEKEIENIFKLYPWEDMMNEDFGPILARTSPYQWIEPAWKMFLSTKILPAAMWYLYPNHKNLLPTYLDGPRDMKEYVKKPLHGREGDNIEIYTKDFTNIQGGRYGAEGHVYQQWCPLPNFKGEKGESNHPVLGAWVINGESRGVGIRESDGYVTDYYCRFVPNYIKG